MKSILLEGRWPRGYWFVALVTGLAAVGIEVFRAIAVAWSHGQARFWLEVAMDSPVAWLCFLLMLVAPVLAWATPGRERSIAKGSWRMKLGIVAGASVLLYALLMQGAMHGLAYTPDEQSAILQARTFAAGRLTPHVTPELVSLMVPKWYQDDFVALSRRTGFYSSTYWPGYALVMAPFALLHIEWLCNPVLTALTLVGIFLLARRLTQSEEAAWWGVALTLCSAQVALQGASYFSMPAHLAINILFCLLFVQNTRSATFVAGLVGGFALVLHNPVPHFSFAFPWIVWMAFARRSHLPALLAGYALVFLPIGLGWSAHLQIFDAPLYVSGGAQSTGVDAHSPGAQVLSRVAVALRPPDAVLVLARGAGLCKLVVWAVPGAVGLALLGWLQARSERHQIAASGGLDPFDEHRFDASYLWLLGVSIAFNFVLYFGVRFDQGHGWGFRYLHQTWLAIPILGGFFLARAGETWKKMAAILCVLSLLLVLPIRAGDMNSVFTSRQRFQPPAPPATPSITFVQEETPSNVWIQNDPFLRTPHWMLRFGSPSKNAALARRFLQNAHLVGRGPWGETWTGTRFSRPGSP